MRANAFCSEISHSERNQQPATCGTPRVLKYVASHDLLQVLERHPVAFSDCFRMTAALRRLARMVLPDSLTQSLHYFRRHGDYIMLPRTSVAYAEDNLYTGNATPFLEDARFLRAYAAGAQTDSWHGASIRWRAYVACWAAEHASRLKGDFVECGVNRGGLARAITEYIDFAQLDKQFYLIDTFAGLVPAYVNEAEREKGILENYAYYAANSKEQVRKTFSCLPNVQIVEGAVPDVLPSLNTSEVAFVSLDMNCTFPEVSAAEHFWQMLVPGGVILLDDYAQKLHSEQQVAFDEFARQRGVGVLALPTGQGLLLKNS